MTKTAVSTSSVASSVEPINRFHSVDVSRKAIVGNLVEFQSSARFVVSWSDPEGKPSLTQRFQKFLIFDSLDRKVAYLLF